MLNEVKSDRILIGFQFPIIPRANQQPMTSAQAE
jgi:hypothetical protein